MLAGLFLLRPLLVLQMAAFFLCTYKVFSVYSYLWYLCVSKFPFLEGHKSNWISKVVKQISILTSNI
jgi:hypothetical protein